MNRRKFLGLLASIPAVAVAAKLLKPEPSHELVLLIGNKETVLTRGSLPEIEKFAMCFNPQHYHGDLQWRYFKDDWDGSDLGDYHLSRAWGPVKLS